MSTEMYNLLSTAPIHSQNSTYCKQNEGNAMIWTHKVNKFGQQVQAKVLIFTNYPHRQNLNISPQYTIRDKASSDSNIQDINDS